MHALWVCASCPMCISAGDIVAPLPAEWWTVNRCNNLPDWWLILLIYDNRGDIHAHTSTAHVPLEKLTCAWAWIFKCHLICLSHAFVILFRCTLLRSRTLVPKGATPLLKHPTHLHISSAASCGSTLFLSTPIQTSPVLRPVWDSTMERSAKELFLNFIIVLITVLLMWLLVKTYQDWSMGLQDRRWSRGRGGGEIRVEAGMVTADWFLFRRSVSIFSFFSCMVTGLVQSSGIPVRSITMWLLQPDEQIVNDKWVWYLYLHSDMFFLMWPWIFWQEPKGNWQ